MKTNSTFLYVLMLMAITSSCATEEFAPSKGTAFYEPTTNTTFNVADQQQLNRLASMLSKENGSITILKDAEVVTLSDKRGDFNAISVQYKFQDQTTHMIVPVEEVVNTKNNTSYQVAMETCIMKFSSTNPACEHEIIERCKTLKISGQGSTSVSFSDSKIYTLNMPHAIQLNCKTDSR